jgi:hypothetical protein
MTEELLLENPRTGAVKTFHSGFDWILFLFSGVFGIPLFLRGLYFWGGVFVALWIIDIAAALLAPLRWNLIAQVAVAVIFFALQLWLGFFGRERIVKAYVARGWRKRDRIPRPRQARKRRP